MKNQIFIVVFLIFGTFVSSEDAEKPKRVVRSAIEYSENNFKPEVEKGPHFIMFFAPWCGHCKKLAPTWEDLAKIVNTESPQRATIARVDCTFFAGLCSAQDVSGYPTLKFFKTGAEKEDGVRYRGKRDLESLNKFITEQLEAEVKIKSEGSGAATVKDFLYTLNSDCFESEVAKADTFVKFYAPWCGHCQKLVPTWEMMAKHFQDDKVVKIAKVDCTENKSICEKHEVKGYPTLVYFREGVAIEKYKGKRGEEELLSFVEGKITEVPSKNIKEEL